MSSRIRMKDIRYFFLEELRQLRIFIDTTSLEGTEHERAQKIGRAVKEQIGFIRTQSLLDEPLLDYIDEYFIEVYFDRERPLEVDDLFQKIADSVKGEPIILAIRVGWGEK